MSWPDCIASRLVEVLIRRLWGITLVWSCFSWTRRERILQCWSYMTKQRERNVSPACDEKNWHQHFCLMVHSFDMQGIPMIFCPLGRNFLRKIFLAFVIVSCLAKGYSPSLSLPSSWYSLSPSPLMARTTNAFALRRCELNSPLIDVTNPSPAPSPGLFNHDAVNWSGFPLLLPSLSLKLRSFSGTVPSSVSLWFWALNFFPCSRPNHQ
jgi:hypothetical protein